MNIRLFILLSFPTTIIKYDYLAATDSSNTGEELSEIRRTGSYIAFIKLHPKITMEMEFEVVPE